MGKIKSYLFVAVALCVSAFMASCDDDKNEISNVTTESVKGNYGGELTVGEGEPLAVSVTVGEGIVINNFPVDSIVKIAVPASIFDEAVASLQAREYEVGYTPEIFGQNMMLDLEPSPLAVDVEYGGSVHEIDAMLYTTKRGNFNGMSNSLSFELLLKSVSLDGEDVHIPSTLKYDFELSRN